MGKAPSALTLWELCSKLLSLFFCPVSLSSNVLCSWHLSSTSQGSKIHKDMPRPEEPMLQHNWDTTKPGRSADISCSHDQTIAEIVTVYIIYLLQTQGPTSCAGVSWCSSTEANVVMSIFSSWWSGPGNIILQNIYCSCCMSLRDQRSWNKDQFFDQHLLN